MHKKMNSWQNSKKWRKNVNLLLKEINGWAKKSFNRRKFPLILQFNEFWEILVELKEKRFRIKEKFWHNWRKYSGIDNRIKLPFSFRKKFCFYTELIRFQKLGDVLFKIDLFFLNSENKHSHSRTRVSQYSPSETGTCSTLSRFFYWNLESSLFICSIDP